MTTKTKAPATLHLMIGKSVLYYEYSGDVYLGTLCEASEPQNLSGRGNDPMIRITVKDEMRLKIAEGSNRPPQGQLEWIAKTLIEQADDPTRPADDDTIIEVSLTTLTSRAVPAWTTFIVIPAATVAKIPAYAKRTAKRVLEVRRDKAARWVKSQQASLDHHQDLVSEAKADLVAAEAALSKALAKPE